MLEEKKAKDVYEILCKAVKNAPKTYFINCLIGYLIAILITIAIMFIFNHG